MKYLNTALVTGGGRGIGKETAILLSKMGMNIVICSRTQKEIDLVVKEIKLSGNNHIMGRKCDVSKSDEVNNLVKETLDNYGRIDLLVNNAGITYVKKLVEVMTICPGEVATKMQENVDPYYYELNKHKMLHPKTVAEKITDMMFNDKN